MPSPRRSGATCRRSAGRVSHVRIDPEIEANGPLDPTARSAGAADPPAGVRPPRSSPTPPGSSTSVRTRTCSSRDLRKKWRQYVNKARTAGVTVVDADAGRLGEFYRIYRETADRAGFLIRAESAYRDVWEAFAPSGNARLLFAQTPDGSRRRPCSSSAAGHGWWSRTAA